jgi:hypothetical protein
MANGIPVRLSEALTVRARSAAQLLDRSLTEQVEHWARLGQVVEAAISAAAVQRLKARSYDPELTQRLEAVTTPAGQAKAVALIRARNSVRYGLDGAGAIVRVSRKHQRSTVTKSR